MAFLTFLESQRDQSPWIWTQKEAAAESFTVWTGTEWTFWITQIQKPLGTAHLLQCYFLSLTMNSSNFVTGCEKRTFFILKVLSHHFLLWTCVVRKELELLTWLSLQDQVLPRSSHFQLCQEKPSPVSSWRYFSCLWLLSSTFLYSFQLFSDMCNSKHPTPDEASLPIQPRAMETLTALFHLPQLHILFDFLIIGTSKQKLE